MARKTMDVLEVQQLTNELRAVQVTRSASKNVNALSRYSGGVRQWEEFDKRCVGDSNA
jgi:hypothetical protein